MFLRVRRNAVKTAAAMLLAGIFAFAAFVAPEHLAAAAHESSHGPCEVCQAIQHAPLPAAPVACDIAPLFLPEWIIAPSNDAAPSSPRLRARLSRAPPLSVQHLPFVA